LGVLAPPTTASPLLVVVVAYEYAAVDIGLDDIDDVIVRREAVAVAVAVAVGWWPRRERHAARRSTMLITILLAERVLSEMREDASWRGGGRARFAPHPPPPHTPRSRYSMVCT
jgi:hypothetical protein